MGEQRHRYAGFISYSQKDKAWAKRLHKALEAYRLPVDMPTPEYAGKKKLGKFFRDDEELAGSPSLGDALDNAIDSAGSLIVVCSPNAAGSKWVDAEIMRFKRRGADARVFAVIVDGQPDANTEEDQCFPMSLRYQVTPDGKLTSIEDEPLAPDVRKEPFSKLVTRIVAGLLDVEFDTLWQREKRRQTRKKILIAASTSAALIIGGFGLYNIHASQQAELRAESLKLVTDAQKALDENRWDDALALTVQALPKSLSKADRPVIPEAKSVLRRLMTDNTSLGILKRYEEPIQFLHHLGDGRLAINTESGNVDIYNSNNQTFENNFQVPKFSNPIPDSHYAARFFIDSRQDISGNWDEFNVLTITNLSNGEILHSVDESIGEWVLSQSVSSNGNLVFAAPSYDGTRSKVGIFDLNSDISQPAKQIDISTATDESHYSSAFFGNNHIILTHRISSVKLDENYIWNLETNTLLKLNPPDPKSCDGYDPDHVLENDKSQKFNLSPDGSIATWSIEVSDDLWCMARWDVKTNQILPLISVPHYSSYSDIGSLSKETVFSFANDTIFHVEGREVMEGRRYSHCGKDGFYGAAFSLIPELSKWNYDKISKHLVCGDGKDVYFYGESSKAAMKGHDEDITIISTSPGNRRIWSAAKDNTLREWTYGEKPNDLGPNYDKIIKSDKGSFIGITESGKKGEIIITNFDKTGQKLGDDILMKSLSPKTWTSKRNFELAGDNRVLFAEEKSECGFRDKECRVKVRVSLFDLQTGTQIKSLDEIAPKNNDYYAISNVRLSTDRQTFLAQTAPNLVSLYNLKGQAQETYELPKEQFIYDIAHNNDTWWILTLEKKNKYGDGIARLFELIGNDFVERKVTEGTNAKFYLSSEDNRFYAEVDSLNKTTGFAYTKEHGLVDVSLHLSSEDIDGVEDVDLGKAGGLLRFYQEKA